MNAGWQERRGGPGGWAVRLRRAEALAATATAASGPLRLTAGVLRYQQLRSDPAGPNGAAMAAVIGALTAGAEERRSDGRYPLLDLASAAGPVATAIPGAVAALDDGEAVPEPLLAAGGELAAATEAQRLTLVDAWLEESTSVDPRSGFWVGVAAGPVLEPARAAVPTPGREEWTGRACPGCGGLPQVSVIAPESGAFMEGSPRALVCGRCAGWWAFPRATCAWCGEDDPRKLAPFVAGEGPARLDSCETCGAYVKTFDLRRPGGAPVVPLVDDVATVSLDLWAQEQGLHRPVVSLAGV